MPALERIMPVAGAPCWVNLMARDLHAAQSFYTEVMDWEFRASTLGNNFSVAMAHGEPVAGIGACSPGGPPTVWTPYFAVRDADETADRVRERGATLAIGPLKIGAGRAALAADRDGAIFGFWEGPALAWSVGRGSAAARLDLQTRHAFEAAIFYAEVFDWAQPPGGCTVDYAQDHVLVQLAGHTVATLRGGGIETAPDPKIRPRWIVDFHVQDGKKAAAAAIEAGGDSSPVASLAGSAKDAFLIRDPDGGFFTVSDD
ncbi:MULTISPECIES: VOC family protein [unclassified Streptomyces]|uniref:VOC family protein n=1 Tax=unclassified Streptomyces TaxID=2593676 RepID=UPI002251E7D6|nr:MULTISPECIES: VOC family protein [unclassified Streptomyces]WSP59226.1 VOC family protein [Streptomyces sp. NBC_01241]WSU20252.1 VOC family protein [Streptomyces sp. NBC_01108]MCX4790977.1 VOC family protein [Streptomyces sp. NBC_01221]MCX4793298.1 VOC family protein [Streptomyces sp. NBC_01242]WSJ34738.1 VOC family protein [Streptomyces sp. NBC_01321]